NPAPDAEVTSVGQENFEWVVEMASDYAIERAKKQTDGHDNLTWGEYVKTSAAKTPLLSHEKKIEKKADKKDAETGTIDHGIAAEGTIKRAKAASPKKTVKK
ncbi:MAG: hypothetical protein ACXVA2_16805, partial [Mucilaginibacter sp.]